MKRRTFNKSLISLALSPVAIAKAVGSEETDVIPTPFYKVIPVSKEDMTLNQNPSFPLVKYYVSMKSKDWEFFVPMLHKPKGRTISQSINNCKNAFRKDIPNGNMYTYLLTYVPPFIDKESIILEGHMELSGVLCTPYECELKR
jgi:hypothetical protein